MRRTRWRPSGLKRTARLETRTPLRPINRKRRARRNAEAFGLQAQLCRELPCAVCQRPAPSDPAHIRSRGAGGKDRGNVLPMCRRHHQLQHDIGWLEMFRRYPKLRAELRAVTMEAYGDA